MLVLLHCSLFVHILSQSEIPRQANAKRTSVKKSGTFLFVMVAAYSYAKVWRWKSQNWKWLRFSRHKITDQNKEKREHNLKKWWFLNGMTTKRFNARMRTHKYSCTLLFFSVENVIRTRRGRECRIYFFKLTCMIQSSSLVSLSQSWLNFNLIQRKNLSHSTKPSGYIYIYIRPVS